MQSMKLQIHECLGFNYMFVFGDCASLLYEMTANKSS